MTKLKLGIDDAGRGPVLGPMILAGCILKEEDESELKKLGVRDSKTLTQKRREFLAQKIQEVAVAYDIKKIYPNEIDFSLNSGTKLNELEANKMAEIVNVLSKKSKGKYL
jgi:ribonuclease HII